MGSPSHRENRLHSSRDRLDPNIFSARGINPCLLLEVLGAEDGAIDASYPASDSPSDLTGAASGALTMLYKPSCSLARACATSSSKVGKARTMSTFPRPSLGLGQYRSRPGRLSSPAASLSRREMADYILRTDERQPRLRCQSRRRVVP